MKIHLMGNNMKELMIIGLTLQLIGFTGLIVLKNQDNKNEIIYTKHYENNKIKYRCYYSNLFEEILCEPIKINEGE